MRHVRTEYLIPGPAEGLAGLLGVPLPDLEGEGLPALWHWIYLLDRPAQADLGPDGHPARGAVATPPAPGMRRMWASGRVRTLGPLRTGAEATRTSYVLETKDKTGKTGAMTFVTVRHEVCQLGRLVVEEDQHIVYRQPPPPAPPPAAGDEPAAHAASRSAGGPSPVTPEQPVAADLTWSIETAPTLLARYSALTYNGHRIHYDRDFARDVEGYPGLLVHGPLQAMCMAEAARRLHGGAVVPVEFDYRLVSPLFDGDGMTVRAWHREADLDTTAAAGGAGIETAVAAGNDEANGRTTATGIWTPAMPPLSPLTPGLSPAI